MRFNELPIPPHFDPARVGEIWRVRYEDRATEAKKWAEHYGIAPSSADTFRACLLLIDIQNTFCIPGFELFVGGPSGTAAVEDNRRLCQFIYRNLGSITEICPTLDTHQIIQIFHSIFLVDGKGDHPAPYTVVKPEDIEKGVWRINPSVTSAIGMTEREAQRYLLHYARQLGKSGKFDLTIWPYHAMLGSIGHALVPSVEEAIFFHSIARSSTVNFQIKGNNPLTENYSVLSPEVLDAPDGKTIAHKNRELLEKLLGFDMIIVAGQAKSHCVSWTIEDMLEEIERRDRSLASRIYLLVDCTSPVVVPGVIDYTELSDRKFEEFSKAGVRLVRSTDTISSWPGIGRSPSSR